MNFYQKIIFIVIALLVLLAGMLHMSRQQEAVSESVDLSHMSNFALGQYYFNHGDAADGTYDIQKARIYYEKALEEDPQGNVLTWHQLGRIDFLEGKFDTAIYKFNKQIQYFQDELPNVHYMLALTYGYRARNTGEKSDWTHAEEHFKKFLVYDPQSPWARTDLGWIYFAQGKYTDMLPLIEEGLTYYPDNAWLLNMYGLALLNTEQKEEALRYLLLAKEAAEKLTVEEWGKSYPGNDPQIWQRGLDEFRLVIAKNIALIETESD